MIVQKKAPCIFKAEISSKHFDYIERFERVTEKACCTYFYFDVKETHKLFNMKIRLRVRSKAEALCLEVKSRAPGCKFEMTQQLEPEELRLLFQGVFPEGMVKERFLKENFPTEVVWINTAFTVRKKIALESNLNDGEWNMEALKSFNLELLTDVGFDQMKLVEFWDKDAKVKNEPFDLEKEIKIAQKTDIKRGNMYQLGRHKLICADATDPNTVIKLMNVVKVDLINQDPPFNIGLSYDKGVGGKKSNKNYGGGTNDSMSDEGYKDFIRKMMKNALSVSKKDCHVAYWADERFVWIFQTLYKELGIASKRLLIWVKNNASPTPRTAFNKATEYIIYGTVGSPYLSPNVHNANEIINPETTTGNDLLDELSNIILQKRLPSNQYHHPTQKDPQVHSKILKRCTKIGDAVLDLTAGSGSIMSACEQLGRVAYMCDYEPVFCQVILNRYKKMTGLNPVQIYEEK